MAIRKNKKFIDPRYFMDEKTETTNEAWDPHGNWKSRFPDGRSKGSDAEPETDEERAHRRAKEAREDERRREAGLPPRKSKYFEENENESPYEPDPRLTRGLEKSMAAEEADRAPEEIMRDVADAIADKFNVEASVEIASDGKPAILVTHQDGETTAYDDTEEMYKDLADEIGRDIHGDSDRDEDNWLYGAEY